MNMPRQTAKKIPSFDGLQAARVGNHWSLF